MKRSINLTILLLAISILLSCSYFKHDPASGQLPPAAKHLIVMKEAIISIAQVADGMCTKSILKQNECTQIRNIYYKAMPVYDTAVDALNATLIMQGTDGNFDTAWQKFIKAQSAFILLFQDIQKLSVEYKLLPSGGAQ